MFIYRLGYVDEYAQPLELLSHPVEYSQAEFEQLTFTATKTIYETRLASTLPDPTDDDKMVNYSYTPATMQDLIPELVEELKTNYGFTAVKCSGSFRPFAYVGPLKRVEGTLRDPLWERMSAYLTDNGISLDDVRIRIRDEIRMREEWFGTPDPSSEPSVPDETPDQKKEDPK